MFWPSWVDFFHSYMKLTCTHIGIYFAEMQNGAECNDCNCYMHTRACMCAPNVYMESARSGVDVGQGVYKRGRAGMKTGTCDISVGRCSNVIYNRNIVLCCLNNTCVDIFAWFGQHVNAPNSIWVTTVIIGKLTA